MSEENTQPTGADMAKIVEMGQQLLHEHDRIMSDPDVSEKVKEQMAGARVHLERMIQLATEDDPLALEAYQALADADWEASGGGET